MIATDPVVAAELVGLVVLLAAGARPSGHRAPGPPFDVPIGEPPTGKRRSPFRSLAARWDRRHDIVEPAAVADWCDDLSRAVRGGASLREALAATLPSDAAVRRRTEPLRHAIAGGAATDDAVRRLLGDGPDTDLAVAVLSTAARLGGSPAAAIDRTAATLRQRSADRDERATQAAQARLSAHVLTVLPVVILGVLLVADTDVRAVVVGPIGAACVVVGLALNTTGWWWMRRVVGP